MYARNIRRALEVIYADMADLQNAPAPDYTLVHTNRGTITSQGFVSTVETWICTSTWPNFTYNNRERVIITITG